MSSKQEHDHDGICFTSETIRDKAYFNLHEMEVGVVFMLTSDQSRAVGAKQS